MMIDWGQMVIEQLEFYWQVHLWPRLVGLTNEEYLWEPVAGCWSLRPDEDGRYVAEFQWPEPSPPPVTTIAWRMAHIAIGCFADRVDTFFPEATGFPDPTGMPVVDGAGQRSLPATAEGGLALLDRSYRRWHDAIAALDERGLGAPLGPKGGPYAESPMAGLIVHINREVMHHGGEICLMRDLYRATHQAGQPLG